MPADLLNDFLDSDDTLRVYRGEKLVFSSRKERLLPLLEYLAAGNHGRTPVAVYDKVMGNAAALLSVRAKAREVYSPLGSEFAVKTLEKYGLKYRLVKIVPFIMRDDGQGMCPMEQLSLGKEPEEFHREMRRRLEKAGMKS
jgi:hypothetical protein